VIDVQNLTKTYGAFKAVDGFSFRVDPGEVVGLIGPNGAGKTSTLRCIVGIQSPSAGTITVGGHDIVKAPVEAKRLLAFMADEPQLFEYLTVMEHLRLTARLYRVRDVESRAGSRGRAATHRQGAGASGRTLARHEAEGRDCLRPGCTSRRRCCSTSP
jgi:ABC-2 type transport system ATP-binding protein